MGIVFCIKQNLIKRDEPRFELIYYEDKSACQIMWNILSPIKAKGEPSFIKFIGMRDLGEGWGERAHNFCLGWKDKFNTITYNTFPRMEKCLKSYSNTTLFEF